VEGDVEAAQAFEAAGEGDVDHRGVVSASRTPARRRTAGLGELDRETPISRFKARRR